MAVPEVGELAQPSPDETVAGLCGTHAILPTQFFFKSGTVRTGEQRLMAAVLEDAIAVYFKPIPPGTARLRPKLQQEQGEADQWLRSNDCGSVFSFLRICEALNLDPQYLRRGLRRLHDQAVTGGSHSPTWMHIRAHTRGRGSQLRVERAMAHRAQRGTISVAR